MSHPRGTLRIGVTKPARTKHIHTYLVVTCSVSGDTYRDLQNHMEEGVKWGMYKSPDWLQLQQPYLHWRFKIYIHMYICVYILCTFCSYIQYVLLQSLEPVLSQRVLE